MVKDSLSLPFVPDWCSPTGDTIRTAMEDLGISKDYLSCCLGDGSNDHLNALLNGEVMLGDYSAGVLAKVLGSTKEFWLRRDARYWYDRKRLEESK
jgi:plasmid maintenance system antidote protein VapI